ncbi:DUF3784 domain-containing protein [Clostridioides difficile]|nr:DUF3784 domain-containing protein [Clostridioides difficile]EKG0799229.1 DUF3784 domain-containing protein [Clostridioides difficile]EKS6830848.1 DUF3784 domain-containing protein [Clostridioides difficile]MBY2252331.1 DUF3784 domain-containing protein [Clostridioides difficile]MCI2384806.1 DUF3784 domain-containing protein [Clostridioides difficile]
MDFTSAIFGVLFTTIGILFFRGKGVLYQYVYEKMSDSEKAKVIPLRHNVGELIVLNGLIFLMKGLWSEFTNHWFTGGMIAWLIIAGFDVWYISKSSHKRN